MTVALPPALTQLDERLLQTGRYADEGEVVREALRVLEHQEFDESPSWKRLFWRASAHRTSRMIFPCWTASGRTPASMNEP